MLLPHSLSPSGNSVAKEHPSLCSVPRMRGLVWNWVSSVQRNVLRGQAGRPETGFLIPPGLLVGELLGASFPSSNPFQLGSAAGFGSSLSRRLGGEAGQVNTSPWHGSKPPAKPHEFSPRVLLESGPVDRRVEWAHQ